MPESSRDVYQPTRLAGPSSQNVKVERKSRTCPEVLRASTGRQGCRTGNFSGPVLGRIGSDTVEPRVRKGLGSKRDVPRPTTDTQEDGVAWSRSTPVPLPEVGKLELETRRGVRRSNTVGHSWRTEGLGRERTLSLLWHDGNLSWAFLLDNVSSVLYYLVTMCYLTFHTTRTLVRRSWVASGSDDPIRSLLFSVSRWRTS